MSLTQTVGSRREFLRGTARYGLLTLMAAVAARIARTRTVGPQTYVNRGPCGGCPVFAGCDLPKANSLRRELRFAASRWTREKPRTLASVPHEQWAKAAGLGSFAGFLSLTMEGKSGEQCGQGGPSIPISDFDREQDGPPLRLQSQERERSVIFGKGRS